MTLRRPVASEHHPRYSRYLDLVPETDLPAALSAQLAQTKAFLDSIPAGKQSHRYAPEKWTVREVFGHVLDTERIFGFRLMTFGRGDAQKLVRADQELYVRNAEFERRTLADLFEEFEHVRRANTLLLTHLPEEAWDRTGVVSDSEVSVRAIGYLMLGHERYHLDQIRSKYLG